ncbi:PR5-like receptor kinase [Euphorbia peplus]|nr:PR5-like receptor kinase [Euphorbia peplus]
MVLYFLNYLFFFIAILINGNQLVFGRLDHINECKSSTCGSNGPLIRFPFRIEGKQPDHCGYPEHWFVLSCSENNETLLHLTPTWKLSIHHINYTFQFISAYFYEDCLPKRVLDFDISLSSFYYVDYHSFGDYTLFSNCSREFQNPSPIPCLSNLHNNIYAFPSGLDDFDRDTGVTMSCIKVQDVSSVPYDFFFYKVDVLRLGWSVPHCTSCEEKGKLCRLQNSTVEYQTECYGSLKSENSIANRSVLITTGSVLGSILLVGAVLLLYRIYGYNKMEKEYQSKIELFLEDYKSFKPTRFSYAHLKRMTNQFKDELDRGAFGTVFKGKLSAEILVAVKLLDNSKGNGEEFVNEVGTIGRIHHVNVVRLIGYCADGFRRALVYEYMPNDSLQKFISSSADAKRDHILLGWTRLQDIALGVAKGIDYLHQGCDQRILHFDIKPQNILLDHDFNPKVSDFGLAKLCGKDQSAVSMTTAKGTVGYMAPEIFSRNFGNVSYKSDVYSFGMLVLEMVGGRKIVEETMRNSEQIYFPEWIYNLLEEGEDLRLEIEEEEDAKIAKKLAVVGLWCIQWNPVNRPSMKTVVRVLEEKGENLTVPPNPFSSTASSRTNTKIPQRRFHPEMDVIAEIE